MRFNGPFYADIIEFQISLTIWACPQISAEVVEPYNTVLYVRSWLEYKGLLVMMDSEALYDISRRSLYIERSTYMCLECFIAQIILCLGVSMCFNGLFDSDIAEFQTGLTT